MTIKDDILEICRTAFSFGMPIDGIFLTGSHATETTDSFSDVDILALTPLTTEWRKFYRLAKFEVDVDLFLIPTVRAEAAIAAAEQPMVQMIALGILIEDSSGRVNRFWRSAQETYGAGPRAPDAHWLRTQRHRLQSVLDDCASCALGNHSAGVTMMCADLKLLSDLYLTTVRKWAVKEKDICKTIAQTDLALAESFAQVASCDAEFAHRLFAFKHIVDTVLEPFGGVLRYFETRRP